MCGNLASGVTAINRPVKYWLDDRLVVQNGLGVEFDVSNLHWAQVAFGEVLEIGAEDVADQVIVLEEVDTG